MSLSNGKHIRRDKSWLKDDKLYIIDFEDPRKLKVYKKIIRPELKKHTLELLTDMYQDTRRFDIMLGSELKKYDVKVVRTIRFRMYDYPKDCITAHDRDLYRRKVRHHAKKNKRRTRTREDK